MRIWYFNLVELFSFDNYIICRLGSKSHQFPPMRLQHAEFNQWEARKWDFLVTGGGSQSERIVHLSNQNFHWNFSRFRAREMRSVSASTKCKEGLKICTGNKWWAHGKKVFPEIKEILSLILSDSSHNWQKIAQYSFFIRQAFMCHLVLTKDNSVKMYQTNRFPP